MGVFAVGFLRFDFGLDLDLGCYVVGLVCFACLNVSVVCLYCLRLN